MSNFPKFRRPSQTKDMTGKRCGKLMVLRMSDDRAKDGSILYDCLCDCGVSKAVRGAFLRNGTTKSCGCLMKVARPSVNPERQSHNLSGSPIYMIWWNMLDRCYNPQSLYFSDYGGRGITVCDQWKMSVESFNDDIGQRPTPKHSMDRIDNDRGYCPENCRWATKKEQASNRRSSHFLECRGERKTLLEWSRTVGMSHSSLIRRLNKGMSIEDALFSPKKWKGVPKPGVANTSSSEPESEQGNL